MDSKPRQKKRIRNPELTREKLLQATVDLVAGKGVEALSMKEVAQRADVSRSVAYLHFEDRDHLLREARAWISERLQDGVQRFDDSTTLYERVLYTTTLELKNPEASRVMMMDALAGGSLDLHDPLVKSVLSRLKKLKKQGGLRPDIDLEILTYIHLGSIAAVLLLWQQHKGGNMDKLAARYAKEWSRILQESTFTQQTV